MMQETIVVLTVASTTTTPEMVTEALGIACDRSWHIGDVRASTVITEWNHGWELNWLSDTFSGSPRVLRRPA
jgi:hypothetical protein